MLKILPHLGLFLALALASLLIFSLDQIHFLAFPKTAVLTLTNPIHHGLYFTSQQVKKQFYFIFAARFAGQENKALKMQIVQLLSENALLRSALAETAALVLQQNALDPRSFQLVPARPIGLDRYLYIDKGSNDGVKLNQVVVFKNSLLGKVYQVSEKKSTVILIADPDSKLSAFSLNKKGKAKGILMGRFGSLLRYDKILHQEIVEEGDLVYTEGLEDYIPRGLILGKVSKVSRPENQIFQQAEVSSLVDLADLDLVFLIKD